MVCGCRRTVRTVRSSSPSAADQRTSPPTTKRPATQNLWMTGRSGSGMLRPRVAVPRSVWVVRGYDLCDLLRDERARKRWPEVARHRGLLAGRTRARALTDDAALSVPVA